MRINDYSGIVLNQTYRPIIPPIDKEPTQPQLFWEKEIEEFWAGQRDSFTNLTELRLRDEQKYAFSRHKDKNYLIILFLKRTQQHGTLTKLRDAVILMKSEIEAYQKDHRNLLSSRKSLVERFGVQSKTIHQWEGTFLTEEEQMVRNKIFRQKLYKKINYS